MNAVNHLPGTGLRAMGNEKRGSQPRRRDAKTKRHLLHCARDGTCIACLFLGDVGVNAAWKTKPSWYVVASEDKAINPELEKIMAKRANAKTTILKTCHVAMLSKPNEVLDVIFDAAKTVGK